MKEPQLNGLLVGFGDSFYSSPIQEGSLGWDQRKQINQFAPLACFQAMQLGCPLVVGGMSASPAVLQTDRNVVEKVL